MRAAVVHESMFGDTREVAEAIADGLRRTCEVVVVPVTGMSAEHLVGVDLLVVGGPTHVRGMSRPTTRQGAHDQAAKSGSGISLEPGAMGPGLREWLSTLAAAPGLAAAFDTRIEMSPLVTGRAAVKIARSLRHRGCHLVTEPQSFLVTAKGPRLVAGELDRARAWGEALAGIALGVPTASLRL